MSWTGVAAFLNMGGYGLYVWGSYAVTLGLLALEAIAVTQRERRLVKRLRFEAGTRRTR